MTDHPNHSDGHPPATRTLIADGGREPVTKNRKVTADKVVTREAGDGDQEMLRIPISSTRSDREGDRFTKNALEDMADQIRRDQPNVFLNHGLAGNYFEAIPYDTDKAKIGALMDAEIESAEDGEHDLYALLNPDGTHEFGEKLIPKVRDEGQPEKFSVGFKILNSDPIEDDAGNEIGREFTRADLMETSDVGIPANPDASVTQSVGAKGAVEGLPGYQKHPMHQMMAAMQGDVQGAETASKGATDSDVVQDATPVDVDGSEETTTRAATDGGETNSEDGDLAELRDDVNELTDELTELRALLKEDDEDGDDDDDDDDDDEEDDSKEECSVDTDCPEGEVCLEGECVPEEDVDDDDDEEESSGVPEDVEERLAELTEREENLQDEISEVRSALESRGDSETGDTDMRDNAPEVEETNDEGEDSNENKTAMDLARESENPGTN